MINDDINRLLSPDGKTGRIRDLIQTGHPVVIVSQIGKFTIPLPLYRLL
jgi:hypothetical protein